jgi:hypothetical protein
MAKHEKKKLADFVNVGALTKNRRTLENVGASQNIGGLEKYWRGWKISAPYKNIGGLEKILAGLENLGALQKYRQT